MTTRRFHFNRIKDESGVSGVGEVAHGVMFHDGKIALHWEGEHSSINIYSNLNDCLFIHGHSGATEIIWDDPPIEKE